MDAPVRRFRLPRPSAGTVSALCVFVVAFAVRFAWVSWVDNPFDTIYSDMGGYIYRALNLANRTPDPFPRGLGFYPFGTHAVYAAEMALVGWQRHLCPLAAIGLLSSAIRPLAGTRQLVTAAMRLVKNLPFDRVFFRRSRA
jgi:hypothetical protein